MDYDEINAKIKEISGDVTKYFNKAVSESRNEAELRTRIYSIIKQFTDSIRLEIYPREEYNVLNGRADAVYNRVIVEYKAPRYLNEENRHNINQGAIKKLKGYMEDIIEIEHRKPERIAGIIIDGEKFIFVRFKDGVFSYDEPVRVNNYTIEKFLQIIASLSTEKALIPENLVKDFGENTGIAMNTVSSLYKTLNNTPNKRTTALFNQWSTQFSEVCDYEEALKTKINEFSKGFGIGRVDDRFKFFFSLHTYYAILIKLIAVQAAHFYLAPKLGTSLKSAVAFSSDEMSNYLRRMENGGIFAEIGIENFLEGDFFSWYVYPFNENIYESIKEIVYKLANYSFATFDVDPDTTRDLLKKLYEKLMPKQLRHNLGEYYTPDWLAERLLNMLGYDGNINTRILDPACGSGTFLVLAIKRAKDYARVKGVSEAETLNKIKSNIVGFDLNPLAVTSSRVNYLLALGDLMQFRSEKIDIPIYICDSIVTPQEGEGIIDKDIINVPTSVGSFSIPAKIAEKGKIDIFVNLIEDSVKIKLNPDSFEERLRERISIDNVNILSSLTDVYRKMLELDEKGVNGIWARIIKNAFAPLFVGRFDLVCGNPPWINWENLPENYRRTLIPLWVNRYKLFPHKGFEAILGKSKDDISILMTYVSIDKYLKDGGKLGFLITQSVFKTSAGKGFRSFKLPDETPLQVVFVDDMSELKPFEGAANRTALIIIRKGKKTNYPVSYTYWSKKSGRGLKSDMTLDEVNEITVRYNWDAVPINDEDPTSQWLTSGKKILKAIKKVLGKSDYKAHEGVNTGGANGVYWVRVLEKIHDGNILIENITEGVKIKVDRVQCAIEPDLVYPLLRGRDVSRWIAEPSANIIITHLEGARLNAIKEDIIKERYPKTYLYLKQFEKLLKGRPAYKRYFDERAPFYSMFDVGDYTFAPWKIVWPWISKGMSVAVISSVKKVVVPEHNASFIGLENMDEAYFICSLMNSSPADLVIRSFYSTGGGGIASPSVIDKIQIIGFNINNKIHKKLAEL